MTTNTRSKLVMREARKIKAMKTLAGKRRHIALWCEMVRDAIRGTDYQSTTK